MAVLKSNILSRVTFSNKQFRLYLIWSVESADSAWIGQNAQSSDTSGDGFSHANFERWGGFGERKSVPTSGLSYSCSNTGI